MINKISFIGAGSMSEAIIEGMIKNEFIKNDRIFVTNRKNEKRLNELKKKYQINGSLHKQDVIENANIIVLAIKPNDLKKAIDELKPYITKDQLIVSVLAGVSTTHIQQLIEQEIAIIRAMPNTSASIGQSATAITKGSFATIEDVELIKQMFQSIGTVTVVNEDDIHLVTGISGSGPAYIYYFVEAIEKVAKEEGLDEKVAKQLVTQTIIGAGKMLKQANLSAEQLRKNVTSPNGTTEAGLKTLSQYNFQEAIISCVKKAKERSIELGKQQ